MAITHSDRAGWSGWGIFILYGSFLVVGMHTFLSASSHSFARRGWEAYNRDNMDDAIALHSEAIRLNPRLAWAYSGRGVAHGVKGELDAALTDLDEAIRLQPKVSEFRANRGWVRMRRG